MYKYFISYTWGNTSKYDSGFGSYYIERDNKIKGLDDLNKIVEYIKNETKNDQVVIISWQPFED